MDQRVFEYLKQAVGNTFDKDRMPTIYLLALTRYFSTLDKVDGGDAELLKTMTSLLLEEGLVFPYTRELSKHIPVPEDIMDKAMVEYRGRKDAHPELQVRILPEETGFHSEDIRRGLPGDFCETKVLFEGEIMEYRIYDYLDGHRRLAAEGQVECDHKLEGKENSRFACLNEMGAAIKDRDDSRLLNANGRLSQEVGGAWQAVSHGVMEELSMDGLVIGLDLNDDYTRYAVMIKKSRGPFLRSSAGGRKRKSGSQGKKPMRPPCWERELSWINFLRWRPRMGHPPSEASATAEVRCLSCS